MRCDVAIVGGGLVGLATGYNLTERFPELSVRVLEKEEVVASHQSGRESGVIHSGIYYRPGSLKAENCREGRHALVRFCEEHGIAHEICGKVIVAVDASERARLHAILQRGHENNIACELIGSERLRELEPYAGGVEAIHVPDAGIADFKGVAVRLAEIIAERGGVVTTSAEVTGFQRDNGRIVVHTTAGDCETRYVVNCAGLYADRITWMTGQDPGLQVVPFRGEYYELQPHARELCRNLIYPVPDPAYPFLGVHFTRMHDGRVECGPSAIVGFAREGYTFGTVERRELWEILRYRGFRKLALRHWRKGILEIRQSLSKKYYLSTLQRLVPSVTSADIVRAGSGVRAQALRPDGTMVEDFEILEKQSFINVCNAASPAATACLNVGRLIVDRLSAHFS